MRFLKTVLHTFVRYTACPEHALITYDWAVSRFKVFSRSIWLHIAINERGTDVRRASTYISTAKKAVGEVFLPFIRRRNRCAANSYRTYRRNRCFFVAGPYGCLRESRRLSVGR